MFENYYDCVGPGWRPILEALGDRITSLSRKATSWNEETGEPVYEILVLPKIAQVKEKFGRIRIYVDFEVSPAPELIGTEALFMRTKDADSRIEEIDACISMAESMSARLCEECGKGGTETRGAAGSKHGWLKTYCQDCHKKRDEKRTRL